MSAARSRAALVAVLAFAALVCGNLTMIHATRSRDRMLVQSLRTSNPILWWITGATLVALAIALYVPPVAALFRFDALTPGWLAVVVAAGAGGALWYEMYKLARPRRIASASARDRAA